MKTQIKSNFEYTKDLEELINHMDNEKHNIIKLIANKNPKQILND